MSYDDPNTTVQREQFGGEAGGGATTAYAKFRNYQKGKLRNVHFVVTTAGTSTAHGFDVYVGTSSVGSVSLGTNTAGYSASAGALNSAFASLDELSVKSLADVVGKADVVYEYDYDWDAVHGA